MSNLPRKPGLAAAAKAAADLVTKLRPAFIIPR
jgi:hypothetical protein